MGQLGKLAHVRLRPPRQVMQALHELAQQTRASGDVARLPRVRLDIGSGHRYVGRILEFEIQGNAHRVLLVDDGGPSEPTALSFLELTEPYQLTLLDAESHQKLLRFGEVSRWSTAAPLAALELKRLAQRTREQLRPTGLELELDERLFSTTAAGSGALADLLGALQGFLDGIRADALGAEALAAVKTIALTFSAGAALAIRKSGERIELTFDPAEGLPAQSDVTAALEAAL